MTNATQRLSSYMCMRTLTISIYFSHQKTINNGKETLGLVTFFIFVFKQFILSCFVYVPAVCYYFVSFICV